MSVLTYMSNCAIYQPIGPTEPKTAIANIYTQIDKNPEGQFPPILPVQVIKTEKGEHPAITNNFQIKIGGINFSIFVDRFDEKQKIMIIDLPPMVTFNWSPFIQSRHIIQSDLIFIITLHTNKFLTPIFKDPHVSGDSYEIRLFRICNETQIGMGVHMTRPKTFKKNNNTNTNNSNLLSRVQNTNQNTIQNTIRKNNKIISHIISAENVIQSNNKNIISSEINNIRVPIIDIFGQTLIDGSDVGDMKFTIGDKFTYYNKCSINKCSINYIDISQLKETQFQKCCPKMVSVVKGKGETLREKLLHIYTKKQDIIRLSFQQFYENVVLYGMLKYILSRILYGKFNINFLLGKFNKQFLKDLRLSRFCEFLEIFIDCKSPLFGYNQFFKCD